MKSAAVAIPGIFCRYGARLGSQIFVLVLVVLAGLCGTCAAQGGPPITIKVVNNSTETVLFAAFGPTTLEPDGGPQNWLQPPGGSLTLHIPPAWYNTQQAGQVGPRIWARTGCRYDVTTDRAQCETGTCGDQFDCGVAGWSQARGKFPLAGTAPVTIGEFCLNCVPSGQPNLFLNYWDVSVVDGANLTMDIQPTGSFSANHPGAPDDVFWCQSDRSKSGHPYAPNSTAGADLRASSVCQQPFLLKSSDLSMYVQNGQYANNNVACFSNCGYYEYPTAPAADCQDTSGSKCGAWRAYCCQATAWGGNKCTPGKDKCEFGDCQPQPGGGGICPGKTCTKDSECAPYATCWTKAQGGLNTCACAGYATKTPCDPATCTNVDQPAAEPPFLKCSQSAGLPGIAGPSSCIGDDTVHTVFPRAYTWPNDPQTYNCDNTTFTVSVSGNLAKGQTSGAVPIPLCSDLPAAYGYAYTIKNACGDPSKSGFTFASALLNPHPGNQWACNISPGTANNAGGVPPGVLCAWHPLK